MSLMFSTCLLLLWIKWLLVYAAPVPFVHFHCRHTIPWYNCVFALSLLCLLNSKLSDIAAPIVISLSLTWCLKRYGLSVNVCE